jgi:hypothetical protein
VERKTFHAVEGAPVKAHRKHVPQPFELLCPVCARLIPASLCHLLTEPPDSDGRFRALARSVRDLITMAEDFDRHGVNFRSLTTTLYRALAARI